MIKWDCPYCGEHLIAGNVDQGEDFDCSQCKAMQKVPWTDGRESSLFPSDSNPVGAEHARWWKFGLIGGVTLSMLTAIKTISAIVQNLGVQADLVEAIEFAAAIFGIGFICGVIVWGGRGLHQRFGMVGDAIVGIVVMEVFFATCMLLFDKDGFQPVVLAMAVPFGVIAGISWARDFRKKSR